MAPIAIAAPSRVPSVVEHIPNSIGATALIGTSTTLPNYTSFTDVTALNADERVYSSPCRHHVVK